MRYVSEESKFIETERELEVIRNWGWGREDSDYCLLVTVSVWVMKKY